MTTQTPTSTHQAVQEYYGKAACEAGACCGTPSREQASSCCDTPPGREEIHNNLYPRELIAGIPADIVNFSAGSGDPITLANLQVGETVLDLGSGGGLDCFLAARQVGETGHVIGVEMTPEMLERARDNLSRMKLDNVGFRQGYLEDMPVDDTSIDVIISNCVINLTPDKTKVFQEMFRVLKPGGRVAVSDIVTNHPLSEEARKNKEDWCGCTTGALPIKEYITELAKAGFVDIEIKPNLEVVRKAIESGQARLPENYSPDQLYEDFNNFENSERTMFVPHKITARKPG